ncbi:ABC-three component system protein [Pseudodesulfovibrio tunisiensis]|uniref:ABC-three component system protein n=1 Tax=Pseudodesulfovibrio tunisiensis TaxID=463192 RepID=UPI001FB4249B|nr:ABC-three component system protein [Pseudodesulfovibrio tunisiensis]
MLDDDSFKDIKAKAKPGKFSSPEVQSGIPVPATQKVKLFSPDEWEEFTEEWTYSLKGQFDKVQRYGGAGDMGCDVVGFKTKDRVKGPWVNFQCKHYDGPLVPSKSWVEIGKIVYYSFMGEYTPPVAYYFVAPQGVGTTLTKILNAPDKIREGLIEAWDKHCKDKITSTKSIPLVGAFKTYLEEFDYSIFDSLTLAELVEGHAQTPFHATRFGGGLPVRPAVAPPPSSFAKDESRYIQQLMEAYSDAKKVPITEVTQLDKWPSIKRHFNRSREQFYHAESLRNFARDNVPAGTYESLQDEIYQGVVDVCESDHEHGFERVKKTVSKAVDIALTGNALCGRVLVNDRQGVCHQLANEDKLLWVENGDD